jgi:hypothetical protein
MRAVLRLRHYAIAPAVSYAMNKRFWHGRDKQEWAFAREKMGDFRPTCVDDVANLMGGFQWRRERIDWVPWIETIFARNYQDDCDGAAVLGQWALKKIGIRSRPVHLWTSGSAEGHDVCVSEDGKILISNSDLVRLDGDWVAAVKSYFDGRFDMVQDGWRFL